MTAFQQKSSFIERLRIILLIIAAFFVLGIMGLYLSSRGFLDGLQRIAQVNQMLNLSSTSLQALITSEENLEKFESGITKSMMEPFRESCRIAIYHLNQSITDSASHPKVHSKLLAVLQAVNNYQSAVEALYASGPQEGSDFKSELLVARQFAMDAEDSLREAHILMKKVSDETFSGVYDRRFDPLIVAGLLSSAFFAFVVVVGLSSARRLRDSLGNLTRATDEIATGNLEYQAPIIEADEFGRLTTAFNVMVKSLNENQHRLTAAIEKVTRLQSITNSFSGALMPEEVFDVIVMDVYKALKADAGAIALVTDEGNAIESKLINYKTNHTRVGMDWHSPVTETIKSGRPRFVEDIESLKNDYNYIYGIIKQNGIVSTVYLPLIAGNQVYGTLHFGYKGHRKFPSDEREFMMALAGQCAQALHRAKLFKAATDAIQVRDEFLSIASHELRTPLTPLKLQLQNMSRQVRKGNVQLPNQDQVLKLVENSDRQVDRLINLIDDLLDVSRISAGRLTLNFEKFNLGEMVEEVIAHYAGQLKDSQVTMSIDKNINTVADKVRMEQVLINLLTNAVKYAPKKPIHVTLSQKDQTARLEVRDEGEGISPDNQKRIFDRFERVRDKNNIGGLGLGLYICRQIVEAHRGTISVSSEPGKGSLFTVEIPIVS